MEENAPVPSTPDKPPVEVNVQNSLNKSPETPGYIAVILLFPCVISGAVLGITGVSKWNLPLTFDNSTWFASLAALGAALGCLIAHRLIITFGPRGSVLLSHVVCAIGWILTFSSSITINLLVGRVLTGLFVGIVSIAATAHSTECFPFRPAARPIVFDAIGVLCVYLAGLVLNYEQTAAVATVATVVSFVLFWLFVPESPAWLESRGRPGDADYSRLKLRAGRLSDGDGMLKGVLSTGYRSMANEAVYQHLHHPDDKSAADEAVNQHLHHPDDKSAADEAVNQHLHHPDVKSAADEAVNPHLHYQDDENAVDDLLKQLFDTYRSLFTRSTRLALQQMSGPLVLVTYAVKLVKDSGVSVINGQLVAVVLATFLVVGAYVSTGVNRRKAASKLASVGTLTAVVVITVYKYVQKFDSQPVQNLVPLLCLVVFSMSISVGPIPRPTVPNYDEHAVGKTVAVRTVAVRTMAFSTGPISTVACDRVVGKTVAGGCVINEYLALAFGYTVAFAVIKYYPHAQAAVGWWVFVFFAVASALNFVYGQIMYSKPKSSEQSSVEPTV